MPAKTWDDAVDWADFTLSGLEISGATLAISAGSNSGTATLTTCYEAASFDHWSKLILSGSRPEGTNIYVRVRVGTSDADAKAQDWSEYINGLDADGDMIFDLRVYFLNEAVSEGGFIQLEVTLVGE